MGTGTKIFFSVFSVRKYLIIFEFFEKYRISFHFSGAIDITGIITEIIMVLPLVYSVFNCVYFHIFYNVLSVFFRKCKMDRKWFFKILRKFLVICFNFKILLLPIIYFGFLWFNPFIIHITRSHLIFIHNKLRYTDIRSTC